MSASSGDGSGDAVDKARAELRMCSHTTLAIKWARAKFEQERTRASGGIGSGSDSGDHDGAGVAADYWLECIETEAASRGKRDYEDIVHDAEVEYETLETEHTARRTMASPFASLMILHHAAERLGVQRIKSPAAQLALDQWYGTFQGAWQLCLPNHEPSHDTLAQLLHAYRAECFDGFHELPQDDEPDALIALRLGALNTLAFAVLKHGRQADGGGESESESEGETAKGVLLSGLAEEDGGDVHEDDRKAVRGQVQAAAQLLHDIERGHDNHLCDALDNLVAYYGDT